MQRPNDFFLTYKDQDIFHHLRNKLPKFKIWYDGETSKGYFEVLAPRHIFSLTATITTSPKGEPHITFPWYVGSKLRKKITDLVASSPSQPIPLSNDPFEPRFAPGMQADPEDYLVSP